VKEIFIHSAISSNVHLYPVKKKNDNKTSEQNGKKRGHCIFYEHSEVYIILTYKCESISALLGLQEILAAMKPESTDHHNNGRTRKKYLQLYYQFNLEAFLRLSATLQSSV
jgi:hypothetical protein